MRFSVTTLAMMPLLNLALADCIDKNGAPYPNDHAGMVIALQKASDTMAAKSPLSPGEHVEQIVVGDKCILFLLDNISGKDRSIESREALDGFTKEYTGCSHGGDSSYTNWRYRVDPNEVCK